MIIKSLKYIASLTLALALAGCIKNDLPYPVVKCNIESISAEGLSAEPTINYANNSVTLPLLETTDIQAVEITDVVITEKAVESNPIVGTHDMRSPLYTTLSLYQEYYWTITAEQNIQRYFTVEGQIGATEWNETDRTAKVYVGFENLANVNITSLKLGPEGISSMSCTDNPDFDESNFGELHDFTSPRRVDVTYHNRTETWYLHVEYTELTVSMKRIDAWACVAWLYGEGLSGSQLGFRYRKEGTEEWITAATESISIDGGSFMARIAGLDSESNYEAVAYSGEDQTAPVTFTTEPILPLPNSGFEEWSKPGKILFPYLSPETAFWDTGNKGSATVGETISEGSTDIRPGSSGTTSAYLHSTFASVAGIGKFAAGNIFVGTYYETVGTNGKVHFGRPFTSRPVALRGWVKFKNGKYDVIDKMPDGMTITSDDWDVGSIYIALGTWSAEEYGGTAESPVEIYTKDPTTFFDKNGKDVVGFGELRLEHEIAEWTEFTIPIEYVATDIAPTHMTIVCSASSLGDYFTGSTENKMYVDDFELVWE